MPDPTDWPRVTVLLLTYEDGERNTAQATLRDALDGLHYSGPLAVHIADDGSVPGHVDALRNLAGSYGHVLDVGSTDAERHGYGRSYNLATQAVHEAGYDGIVLPLEDDWSLTRPLDLDPLVETLRLPDTGLGIACIRMGYLGFTQPLYGQVVHTPAGPMLRLNAHSDEPHVPSGHPRLETVTYQRAVGPWTEGLAPGATEFDWCHRPRARMGVAWPFDLGPASQRSDSLFVHTGAHGLGEVEPDA